MQWVFGVLPLFEMSSIRSKRVRMSELFVIDITEASQQEYKSKHKGQMLDSFEFTLGVYKFPAVKYQE